LNLFKKTIRETTPFDWILLTVLLFFSLSGFVFVKKLIPAGDAVIIEVNGKKAYQLSIGEDRIVDVRGAQGITRVEIKDQRVRVVDSECPQKICVRQGWIRQGAIICLPNRVVVTIEGDEERKIDAITG
jgi:hypothetical protein